MESDEDVYGALVNWRFDFDLRFSLLAGFPSVKLHLSRWPYPFTAVHSSLSEEPERTSFSRPPRFWIIAKGKNENIASAITDGK